MCLFIANRFIRAPYKIISCVRLKMSESRKSDVKVDRKLCSECNKLKEDHRLTRNSLQCCCSCKPEKYDFIEGVVCKQTDIRENEMKLLPLGEDGAKVLLIKQHGELHAIGTKCSHYGALLHTGALGDGRVRCPWHGACFNIKTGDIEDYPGLDSLPCYKVRIDDETDMVYVRARRKDLDLNRRLKDMSARDPANETTAVIIGGGPAGATCAESLRQENFTGKIVMVCLEQTVPYDRVKVSKALDFDVEKAALRPPSFYAEHSIDVKLGLEAIGLNTSNNIVELSNKEKLTYNHLFICTGSKPRVLDVPGADLSNIFVLRNYTDSHNVNSKLSEKKNLVVFGLGFIGLEAAAYCVGKCASVTVVGRSDVPLEAVFGTEIGIRIREEFEAKGVKFIFGENIKKFTAKENDSVDTVVLTDSTVLPADIVIIGIGSTFYTDWLKDSSIKMLEDGSIVVDKYLRTNVENVYAGGDIAYAPLFHSHNISAAIGHYPLAHYHGKIAALNISGKKTALNAVPYFWTTLFGRSYRYAGYGKPDKIQIYGSLEDFEFFAYYIKDGVVIAMSSVGADPIVSDFANFMHEGKSLKEREINTDPFAWIRNPPKNLVERFENKAITKL